MAKKSQPNIIKMTRAPFLSSIIAPLLFGSFAAASVTGNFLLPNFFLVMIIGLGLHVATNVYNDIYDTFQGTDKVNVNRNEFSGGSGVLVDNPELVSKMFLIARSSLIIAFCSTVGLMFFIDENLFPHLLVLVILAAFFSKFYTAAPVKLAYRGWGEISVWFAFGPMAVLIASVSQNLGFHETIILLMPISGLSTLSILLIGQLIDLKADADTGKLGFAARKGSFNTAILFVIVQILILINILVLPVISSYINYWVYLALIPYLFLSPVVIRSVFNNHSDPEKLKSAAKQNVMIHLTYSFLLSVGLAINYFQM